MRRPNRTFLSAQPLSQLCFAYIKCAGKSKAIHVQAWTEPEGFRKLRLPDFKIIDI
jgi:hypothetical protein